MTLSDLDRVIEAINALRTMRDTKKPRKLDEALTWRANDELAEQMAREALTILEEIKENAQEVWTLEHEVDDPDEPYVHAYRSPEHPHLTEVSPWAVKVPALLITPEDPE